MNNPRYRCSEELLERALRTIPLGSQTFSKSITQFPKDMSPLFIARGKGSHVWDVDGNEYIDFVNGLSAVMIGYADPDITKAVIKQLEDGVLFSLPHPLEMEVAEIIVELIPCAEKVRFGKNGSDATAAAIRLARAFTSRDHVLVCGYHGWQDWYIGSTARDLGVPQPVKALTHAFPYNDVAALEEQFSRYADGVAAVIMEPMNVQWPDQGYLERVKNLTRQNGALLVFDETVTGCRFSRGGAQELLGVTPDLATLGKGLANGFPLSAIVGRADIMSLMEDIFFSGTFGGETASLASAKAVLTMVRDSDVVQKLQLHGDMVLEGVRERLHGNGLTEAVNISGHPSWSILSFLDTPRYTGWEIKTLYLQEMFRRGILTIGTHNMSYAHEEGDVSRLLEVYDEVLPLISRAIADRNLVELLEGAPLEPLFRVR